jgi:hypothetical protein
MTTEQLRDRIAQIVKIAHPRWLTHADVYGQIPGEDHARVAVNMYFMDDQEDRIILNPTWRNSSTRGSDKTYGLR